MRKIIVTSIVLLLLVMGLKAQTARKTVTADIPSLLEITVNLSNVVNTNVINFGTIAPKNQPVLANNGTTYSFAQVNFALNGLTDWEVILYTDNAAATANPQYTGTGNADNGDINDGSGLINTADTTKSIPLKVWYDTKFLIGPKTGQFVAAPCALWDGSSFNYNVPAPDVLNKLYWTEKGEDLNGSGVDVNGYAFDEITPTSDPTWTEAAMGIPPYTNAGEHRAYDANGDGDTTDTIQTLIQVNEYSAWRKVVDKDSPNHIILVNRNLIDAYAGNCRTFFGITDEIPGSFATDQLIYELVVK